MIYVGIDNGVTGTIGAVNGDGTFIAFTRMPTFRQTSYLKTKHEMRTRILVPELRATLEWIANHDREHGIRAYLERPMINGARFKASISASAALEATLICLEAVGMGYEYIDSKAWQKLLLPKGTKKEQLKTASLDVGIRLYPQAKDIHEDCDGLLIAEWARRTNNVGVRK